MSVIFISHSSQNTHDAIKVRDWLRNEGYAETFLDLDPQHGLAPGQRWQEELKKAGERCSAIVLVVTPDWAASEWCQTEFLVASHLGKKIFPIIVQPTPFESLRVELKAHYQMADASTPELHDDGYDRLRIGLRRAGVDPKHFSWPPESDPTRSPYRGLQALEEIDAAVFFGRDAQVTAGLDALRRMRSGSTRKILTIAAASGAGKSSFLKAGLLSRLNRDTEDFFVLPTVRPGSDALDGRSGLLAALGLNDQNITSDELATHLKTFQDPVVEQLAQFAAAAGEQYQRPAPTLVLPIDQAEEIFSSDNVSGQDAIELLITCLDAKPDLLVVATIRSDSLGSLQADSRIAEKLELFNLPALAPTAFREVIEGPGLAANPPIKIEPALTDRLIADLDKSDALPLLAFTLERLVTGYGDDHLLELHEYTEGLGGVSGAINAAVAAAMQKAESDPALPNSKADLDALARSAFIPGLVQLDEADASPKRKISTLDDLPKASRPLIQHLVEERLLVTSERDGAAMVEVSHESVLRNWIELTGWIEEERTVLVGLQRIQRSAAEWAVNEKTLAAQAPALLVHRGERLVAAEQYFERADMAQALSGWPVTYLKACREAEDADAAAIVAQAAREKRQEARGRLWRRLTSVTVFVALGFAGWGLLSAEQGKRTIEKSYSQMLLAESRAAANSDIGRALRLGVLASSDTARSPAAKGAQSHTGFLAEVSTLPVILRGHLGTVRSADFSADGKQIVTASTDRTARVWSEGENGVWTVDILEGHLGTVWSARFSPTGTRIVTASEDKTVRVWSQDETGDWTRDILHDHRGAVYFAEFSSDGTQIVTASEDKTARVWSQDEAGDWTAAILDGHPRIVRFADFSPDGTQIVTIGNDETARVWSQNETGAWTAVMLEGAQNAPHPAEFSPDSKRIVTASGDYSARVWSQDETGKWAADTLEGHQGSVRSVKFSPAGTQVVTASADKTARVWSQDETGTWIAAALLGHEDAIWSAEFTPDGTKIVTASMDGTARLWRLNDYGVWTAETLEGHHDNVWSARFSSDGTRVVTASDDHTARVWSLDQTTAWNADILQGHQSTVLSAEFSPDGKRSVTASLDHTARVWSRDEVGTWTAAVLKGHEAAVESAEFSSDGTQIVTASRDGTASLWTLIDSGAWNATVLKGHEAEVLSARFSPDDARIVTSSRDNTARVWSADETGNWSANTVLGHQSLVQSAEFSPDGAKIVTTSMGGLATIWIEDEADTWTAVTLDGHEGFAGSAEFSPDGTQIVTTALGAHTARVWSQDETGAWNAVTLEGHDRSVESAEFSQDGMQIVTASLDKTARVWSQDEVGTWTAAILEGHQRGVWSAEFSPGGTQIVTASADGTARIWATDESGTWTAAILEGHQRGVWSAEFSPDGTQIVTASADGTARIWNIVAAMNDSSRIALRQRGIQIERSLIADICSKLKSKSSVWSSGDPQRHEQSVVTAHTLIMPSDIEAVPLLSIIGSRPGDDVCELAKPKPLDALVSRILPRSWWSTLGN